MADFLSLLTDNNTNTMEAGTNFSPVTPDLDVSNLYSNQGSFLDSAINNGGIDPMAGVNNNLATQEQGGFFINEQGGAGWGTHAIGAGVGLAQTFLGFSQLSEGKGQNKIAQQQWQSQFDIQKEEYDRRVSERQARIANANAAKAKAKGG